MQSNIKGILMSSYLNISVNYDKQVLLDLYTNSAKQIDQFGASVAVLESNFFNAGEFASILEQLPLIPQDDKSFKLVSFTGDSAPRSNPNTNGVLVLPISGSITYKTYDLLTVPLSLLPSSNISEETIQSNKLLTTVYQKETVSINTPTIIRTDNLFSVHAGNSSVALLVHMPKSKSWTDISEEIDWDNILNQLG